MHITPDNTIFWEHGFFKLNATIVWTWVLMIVLVVISRLVTRKLRTDDHPGRWQVGLEIIVLGIQDQLKEIGLKHPRTYIGFIGSLFLL